MNPSYYIFPGLKQNYLTPRQLSKLKSGRKDSGSLELIFGIVCDHYNVNPERVKLRCREHELVWVRQLYCYMAKKFTSKSLKAIGSLIGNRDHTTVIHSKKVAQDLIDTCHDLATDAEVIGSLISDKLFIENKSIKDLKDEP